MRAELAPLLDAWLVAGLFWMDAAIGCLVLAMTIRLVPGRWVEELSDPTRRYALLAPVATVAFLPLLIGRWGWDWPGAADRGYLSGWAVALRSLAILCLFSGIALALLRRSGRAAAVTGLILVVLLDTIFATDWVVALDPGFHSSGFGLYLLSIQACIALALVTLVRIRTGPRPHGGLLGALMLTLLLLWAYSAFMQYFILWSGNLPYGVRWYQKRAAGLWSAVEWGLVVLHGLPILLLLFPPLRRSARALMAASLAVLLGKALETAWLVLPAHPASPLGQAAALLLLAGLGATLLGLRPMLERAHGRLFRDAKS